MEQDYKEEDDYGEETQEVQGVRPLARHDEQQGLQTVSATGWDGREAWEIVDMYHDRCMKCGEIVRVGEIAAHHEKTETHNGAKITPCDAKRISSDGP